MLRPLSTKCVLYSLLQQVGQLYRFNHSLRWPKRSFRSLLCSHIDHFLKFKCKTTSFNKSDPLWNVLSLLPMTGNSLLLSSVFTYFALQASSKGNSKFHKQGPFLFHSP